PVVDGAEVQLVDAALDGFVVRVARGVDDAELSDCLGHKILLEGAARPRRRQGGPGLPGLDACDHSTPLSPPMATLTRATKPSAKPQKRLAADVRNGLGKPRKTLPSWYFYDDLGSQLFEAICQLPWYPITRAERSLLERFAPAMARALPAVSDLV